MLFVLRNALIFAIARGSRLGVLILVAIWFGVSSETDSFFLAYALVAMVATAAYTVFGHVAASHLHTLERRTWLLAVGVAGILAVVALAIDSSLLLALAPYLLFSLSSSIVAGRTVARGRLLNAPVAAVVGALASVGVLVALHFTREVTLLSVVWALSIGEFFRLILLFALPWQDDEESNPPKFSLLTSQLAVGLLFSVPQFISRLSAGTLEDGRVSELSYALLLLGAVTALFSGGIFAVNSFLWRGLTNREVLYSLKGRTLVGVVLVTMVSLWLALGAGAGAMLLSGSPGVVARLSLILILSLPISVVTYTNYSALAITLGTKYLLLSGLIYSLAASGLLVLFGLAFGIYGIAWAYVLGHIILFFLLRQSSAVHLGKEESFA
ncbi:hypothetical protein LCGC14_1437580 [marine sediment metagenome]|uniref:Uncharacterized protein n=1 Tax=marine sediment metagenome TaxID=412755 RepID=A0A0F9JLP4_9ZZZZ